MNTDGPSKFKARKSELLKQRIVVEMPFAEVKAVDDWAEPAGMRSRAQAVRELIKRGLVGEALPE